MRLEDPYIWLEDLEKKETLEFINKHNEVLKKFLNDLPSRFMGRIKKYYGVPYVYSFKLCEKGIYFILRSSTGYSVEFLSWDGVVREIVSSKVFGENVVISEVYPSKEGGILGVSYTVGGSDEGYIRFIDVNSGDVVDELRGTIGNVVWINDREYYYARLYRSGETPDGVKAPAERIFKRRIGSGVEELVFGEKLPTNYLLSIHETNLEDRVFTVVWRGWSRSTVYGGYLNDPTSWKKIFDGGEYLVKPVGYAPDGSVAYLAYYDGEGLGRIISVDSSGIVREVVGEQEYPLEHTVISRNKIYAVYLVNASSRLRIYSLDGELLKEIVFRKLMSISSIDVFRDRIVFTGESFDTPSSMYLIDTIEDTYRKLYGAKPLIELNVEEAWTTSSNGTRIHMFIVGRENSGGEKPCSRVAIVYGYGGFGISITPFYLSPLIPFIEDGGTVVIANLRGGGEYGEKWHRMGRREYKQNVFEDYKAVLKYIKSRGYRTIGFGSSNGGLLVAATMAQAPQLFDAAIIGYPVIDMLRFHKLYIGSLWVDEYGDPDNPRDREYLIKYSPYHNVGNGVMYPPTLVYTGLHDDRVHPGHALKFVAKLEDVNAPVYLRVETSAGHRGASPEVKIREYSDILAFVYKTLCYNY